MSGTKDNVKLVSALSLVFDSSGALTQVNLTPTNATNNTQDLVVLVLPNDYADTPEDGSFQVVTDFDTLSGIITSDEELDRKFGDSDIPAFRATLKGNTFTQEEPTTIESKNIHPAEGSSGPLAFTQDAFESVFSWEKEKINCTIVIVDTAKPQEEQLQYYNVTIDLNNMPQTVTVLGDEPSGPTDITSVTLSMTDPTAEDIGQTANAKADVTAALPDGALTHITGKETKWNPDDGDGNYKEGTNTVEVTLTLDSTDDFKFTESTTAAGWTVKLGSVTDGKSITFTKTVNLHKTNKKITGITANLDGPQLNNAPGDATEIKVTDGETPAAAASETVTPEWTPPDRANSTNFAAGVEYTATFTVTAPAGYEFGDMDSTVTVTITADNGVNGTAEVTVKYSAIEKKVKELKCSGGKATDQTLTEGATYTPAPASIIIVYNDGSESAPIAAADYASYGIVLDTTALGTNGKAEGTTTETVVLTCDTGEKEIKAHYKGGDSLPPADDGGVADITVEVVTVIHPLLGDVIVKAKLPTVGENIKEISSPDASATLDIPGEGLNDEGTNIKWYNQKECTDSPSGKLPYGGVYFAKVEVDAAEDYNFNDSPIPSITLTNTDTTHPNDLPTINPVPVKVEFTDDGHNALTAVFEITMPSAPSIVRAEPSPYDYYNDSQDLTITLSKALIDNLSGANIKIGKGDDMVEVPATLDPDGKTTITVTAAEVRKFLQQKWGTGAEAPLTASHVQEEWDIHIPIERSGNTIDGTAAFKAINTTPYLTVERTENGTITVKQADNSELSYDKQSGGATLALKKTGEVTVTAEGTGEYKFKSWTPGSAGTGETATRTFTPAASGTYTVGADFEGPIEMTVSAEHGTVTSVKEADGDTDADSAGEKKYKLYPGTKYVVTVTPNTDYKFSDSAWTPSVTIGDGTDAAGDGGARTYTFTAPGSNFTLTANLVEDTKTLQIKKTGEGTITVKGTVSDTISGSPVGDTTTYTIKKSEFPVTVTAEADSDWKLTKFGTEVTPAVQKKDDVSYTYDNVPSDAVDVVFTAKQKPAWNDEAGHSTADQATHQKNMGLTPFKYEHTATDDYELKSITIAKKDGNAVLESLQTNPVEISVIQLNTLDPGEYTVTFTFKDKLNEGSAEFDYTLPVRTFKISASPVIESVILPDNLKHGANMGTFKIKIQGGDTYTYTAADSNWDKTPPSGITITITNGGAPKKSNISLDEFI